jgi:hypothetical protein
LIDDRAIFVAIAQGNIEDLIQSGIFNWKFEEPYQSVLKACQIIHLRGDDITLLALHSEVGDGNFWGEIKETWKEAKTTSPIYWRTSAERIVNRNLISAGNQIAQEIGQVGQVKDPRKHLANVHSKLTGLLDSGSIYNPSPSFHYQSGVIGEVVASTGLPSLDRIMGGIWSQALVGITMPSNHGKSTNGYTLLAEAIKNNLSCALFTFETAPATATARVLSALTGLHYDQAVKKDIQSDLKEQGLAKIDACMTLYDNSFNDPSKMEQVIRLQRPMLVVIDHIGMLNPATDRNTNRFDQIGDMCDQALRWTIAYNNTIVVNSQLSNEKSEELKRKHDLEHVALFGSSRAFNAMDFVLVGIRHWSLPNVAYFRCKKNRKDGVVDTECLLRHNVYTQSYEER